MSGITIAWCSCCAEAVCTFTIRVRLNICWDDDAFPPSGPLFIPVGGFQFTGRYVYNGVTVEFGPINSVQGSGINLGPIDRVDDVEEITIEIDPVLFPEAIPEVPFPTAPDYCFLEREYHFDPKTFVPVCGITDITLIGFQTRVRIPIQVTCCWDDRIAFGASAEHEGIAVGLEGATILVTIDSDSQESQPFPRLALENPCSSPSSYLSNYSPYTYVELDNIIHPLRKQVTWTFNPPPGIPGYVSRVHQLMTDMEAAVGPDDTCGISIANPGVIFTPYQLGNILDTENFVCHGRGWPISRRLNYSDGIFSGILTCLNGINDPGGGVSYEGILSGFCADAWIFEIKQFPQISCCKPGGGNVQAKIRVAVSGGSAGLPIPPGIDPFHYYTVFVEKTVPVCGPFWCVGQDVPWYHTKVGGFGDSATVPDNIIQGIQWKLREANYTPLNATVSLNYPALPQNDYACLRGTATITEIL
jgi:hypothetical protein